MTCSSAPATISAPSQLPQPPAATSLHAQLAADPATSLELGLVETLAVNSVLFLHELLQHGEISGPWPWGGFVWRPAGFGGLGLRLLFSGVRCLVGHGAASSVERLLMEPEILNTVIDAVVARALWRWREALLLQGVGCRRSRTDRGAHSQQLQLHYLSEVYAVERKRPAAPCFLPSVPTIAEQ
jgi:hypothetical protein